MAPNPSASSFAPAPIGGYRQFVEVPAGSKLLFISGQIGETPDGTIPPLGKDQCLLAWQNVLRQLETAGFAPADLIKATVFLTTAELIKDHQEARNQLLGIQQPALSVVVVSRLADPRWCVEVEVIAARRLGGVCEP